MEEFNKIRTPKKKRSECRTNTPPEIKKYLPYPSEKTQRSKDADAHNPSEMAFSTPSEILVHRGVCILNGWPFVSLSLELNRSLKFLGKQ
jgi:hypothetical protein